MGEALFRFAIVWISLHIILLFVEMYRYKHSDLDWRGFKKEGLLYITNTILAIDEIGSYVVMIMGLGYWILQPIIK